MSAIKLVVAILMAGLILAASVPSLRARWPHAVPRTLTFLLVLMLAVSNAGAWLQAPLSPPQIVSWLLVVGSVALAPHLLALLHRSGRPRGDIDHTTTQVVRGVHRWIRYPLYLSLILVAIGSLLKRVTPWRLTLAGSAVLLLYLTAWLEERHSASKFGPAYTSYARRAKMFLPGILRLAPETFTA
jgi:protein-S-isoprenylcysteine O-methyltransferase Ste14